MLKEKILAKYRIVANGVFEDLFKFLKTKFKDISRKGYNTIYLDGDYTLETIEDYENDIIEGAIIRDLHDPSVGLYSTTFFEIVDISSNDISITLLKFLFTFLNCSCNFLNLFPSGVFPKGKTLLKLDS